MRREALDQDDKHGLSEDTTLVTSSTTLVLHYAPSSKNHSGGRWRWIAAIKQEQQHQQQHGQLDSHPRRAPPPHHRHQARLVQHRQRGRLPAPDCPALVHRRDSVQSTKKRPSGSPRIFGCYSDGIEEDGNEEQAEDPR